MKSYLKTKSEKEAMNAVLKQFDTDVQSAEATSGMQTILTLKMCEACGRK